MADKSPFQARPVIRLLLPFDFEPSRLTASVEALGGAGKVASWEPVEPRHSYVDELTDPVRAMLFGGEGERHSGRLLRVESVTAQRWFQGATLAPERRDPLGLKLLADPGIELFLTGHGAGALSLSFELGATNASELLDGTYRLVQRTRRRADPSWIRIPHPSEDAERWAKVPADKRAELEAELANVPGDDAPLASRLARRGARFTLGELADELLAPLAKENLSVREGSFLAYVVVRLGADADPSGAVGRDLAVRLAQVEESTHAGGTEMLTAQVLNAKHVFAVSTQGTAHVVADQEGVPFNDERVPRVRDKYFVPYLAAVLQRATLRRINERTRVVLTNQERDPAAVRALRVDLLELGASGIPAESCTRSAVQAYADACRAQLMVAQVYQRASESIAGIEQVLSSSKLEQLLEAQRETAVKTEKSLHAAHELHGAVAWIETFIVIAYTLEVVHLLEAAYAGHGEGASGGNWGHVLIYVAAMVISGGIAAAVLKPWKHTKPH